MATVFAEGAVYEVLEPLRFLSNAAAGFDIITRFIVFFLSLALMVIAILAFNKTKSARFKFVAAAFLLFAVKWGLKILDVFFSPGTFLPDSSENVFELLIFVSLFLAIFKK